MGIKILIRALVVTADIPDNMSDQDFDDMIEEQYNEIEECIEKHIELACADLVSITGPLHGFNVTAKLNY